MWSLIELNILTINLKRKQMKKIAIHWQIIIGLILGLVYGIFSASFNWGVFTTNWIAPIGIIFINLLKLIAMPLVLSSLITGVASLSDLKKLRKWFGVKLSIKTVADNYERIEDKLLEVHPYDLPEIISLPIMYAYGPYAEWVDNQCGENEKFEDDE